ncbi:MAG: hypothetical protein LBK07_11545 [Tannerella sp.]|jgi:hypothetical protein|nr:hypothetical protein [Tannerella sp.]
MLRFSGIIMVAMWMMGCVACNSQSTFDGAVEAAVHRQLETYPKSTLKDLYKNFFQDRFGPGHLVQDTASSGSYLRDELSSFDRTSGAYYEPAGWEGNYCRVNLSVVKENLVPYDVYFDAFVRSVNGIAPPSVEEWAKEWHEIDAIIQKMNLSLTDCDVDRKEIFNMLEQGEYVAHHSKTFEENYSPHYRIMEKSIFEKEIRPFLPDAVK